MFVWTVCLTKYYLTGMLMAHLTMMFNSLNEANSKSVVRIILLLIKLTTSHINFKPPCITKMPMNSVPQARCGHKI